MAMVVTIFVLSKKREYFPTHETEVTKEILTILY